MCLLVGFYSILGLAGHRAKRHVATWAPSSFPPNQKNSSARRASQPSAAGATTPDISAMPASTTTSQSEEDAKSMQRSHPPKDVKRNRLAWITRGRQYHRPTKATVRTPKSRTPASQQHTGLHCVASHYTTLCNTTSRAIREWF